MSDAWMLTSPLSYFSFSIILLQAASYSQDSRSMMGMWFIFLVPDFIVIVVLRGQNTTDEEELEASKHKRREEEEIDGDDDHKTNNDDEKIIK